MRGSFEMLKLASNIEIGVEFWICFLVNFQLKKKSDLQEVQNTLMQNSVAYFFSWKLKENKRKQEISIFNTNHNTSNETWSAHKVTKQD
jgi:hypothetical protein